MTNDNVLAGIRCPNCNSEESFTIVGTATFLHVTDDGCDEFEEMSWDAESDITCNECSHNGIIEEFSSYEDDDDDEVPQGEVVEMDTAEDLVRSWKG